MLQNRKQKTDFERSFYEIPLSKNRHFSQGRILFTDDYKMIWDLRINLVLISVNVYCQGQVLTVQEKWCSAAESTGDLHDPYISSIKDQWTYDLNFAGDKIVRFFPTG